MWCLEEKTSCAEVPSHAYNNKQCYKFVGESNAAKLYIICPHCVFFPQTRYKNRILQRQHTYFTFFRVCVFYFPEFWNHHKNNFSKQWMVIFLYTIGNFMYCHIYNFYENICKIIIFNRATPNINYLLFYFVFPCWWHLIYHKITNN